MRFYDDIIFIKYMINTIRYCFSDSIKKSNKLCKNASVDETEERIKYNLVQAPFNKSKNTTVHKAANSNSKYIGMSLNEYIIV